jgi:hypothetical protein
VIILNHPGIQIADVFCFLWQKVAPPPMESRNDPQMILKYMETHTPEIHRLLGSSNNDADEITAAANSYVKMLDYIDHKVSLGLPA